MRNKENLGHIVRGKLLITSLRLTYEIRSANLSSESREEKK